MMSPERWQKMEEVYHAALECVEEQRAAFVDSACEGDEELRREVSSLLSAHAQGGGLLEVPPDDIAAEMVASAENKAMVGRTLSHYQIIAPIGEGGMGKVYLARDTRLKRNLALKLLPQEFMEDHERVRRFQQEALAASALNHPNILTVYEVGQTDGLHFIATEFIDGQTLRQQMAEGPMKLLDVVEIAAQVASALSASHNAGIVHRDIKPENVMLRRDGYVKVLDFGIAKLIELFNAQTTTETSPEQSRIEPVRTQQGQAIGTPRYMSPEQIRGQEIDGRSDLFSLGLMLYEMATGRQPFAGNTPYELVAEIVHSEAPRLRLIRPEASQELERIIGKALAKDRDERYQNSQEMLADLKNLKLDLEVENKVKRVSAPTRPQQHITKKLRIVAFVAGLIAFVVIGVFVYRLYFRKPGGVIEKPVRQVAASDQIELLRYSLGVELDDRSVTRTTNQRPLTAGQSFRFHFTPRVRGYLYIIGPGEGNNIPRTFLTAQPVRSTGVTTNHLEAGTEYTFPLGAGNHIELGAVGTTNNFTIIFSPTPLTNPAFLHFQANHQLTESEQHELATFWEQHGKRAPALTAVESLKQVAVTVSADRDPDEPLIFEISVKRQ